ncbi:MAG TPA: phospholipase D-like domain-containing protein [Rhodoblastus sp.]|nr:phosphatidylserine synthase [Rhodoblastus sp.]HPG02261.1 phospholipase D-like domain-containing protein [Rhodoblastus sp.]
MARLFSLAVATIALAVVNPPKATHEPAMAGVRLFYGPSPETAAVDAATLGRAKSSIDMAAYVLTDRGVIEALAGAARRGVKVRVYLDGDDASRGSQKSADALAALDALPSVAVRRKAAGRDSMHLKSYLVDRRILRTGSANFSYSGERFQDNDVVVLESPALAGAFARNFESIWARADNREAAR